MDFGEALQSMKDGAKVRRERWIEECFIYLANDNRLRDEEGDDYLKQQGITEDILANDWEEVEE